MEIEINTLAICKKCDEQAETVLRCAVCNGLFCQACNVIKHCDLCEAEVCPDCRIESSYNMAVVCGPCFDGLFITKNNWDSLTQSLNESIEISEKKTDSAGYEFALSYLVARLKTMKAQYEF